MSHTAHSLPQHWSDFVANLKTSITDPLFFPDLIRFVGERDGVLGLSVPTREQVNRLRKHYASICNVYEQVSGTPVKLQVLKRTAHRVPAVPDNGHLIDPRIIEVKKMVREKRDPAAKPQHKKSLVTLQTTTNHNLTIEEIVVAVESYYGCAPQSLRTSDSSSVPYKMAMYIIVKFNTNKRRDAIANYFGVNLSVVNNCFHAMEAAIRQELKQPKDRPRQLEYRDILQELNLKKGFVV